MNRKSDIFIKPVEFISNLVGLTRFRVSLVVSGDPGTEFAHHKYFDFISVSALSDITVENITKIVEAKDSIVIVSSDAQWSYALYVVIRLLRGSATTLIYQNIAADLRSHIETADAPKMQHSTLVRIAKILANYNNNYADRTQISEDPYDVAEHAKQLSMLEGVYDMHPVVHTTASKVVKTKAVEAETDQTAEQMHYDEMLAHQLMYEDIEQIEQMTQAHAQSAEPDDVRPPIKPFMDIMVPPEQDDLQDELDPIKPDVVMQDTNLTKVGAFPPNDGLGITSYGRYAPKPLKQGKTADETRSKADLAFKLIALSKLMGGQRYNMTHASNLLQSGMSVKEVEEYLKLRVV